MTKNFRGYFFAAHSLANSGLFMDEIQQSKLFITSSSYISEWQLLSLIGNILVMQMIIKLLQIYWC